MSNKKILFVIAGNVIIAIITRMIWLVAGISAIAIIYLLLTSDFIYLKKHKKNRGLD